MGATEAFGDSQLASEGVRRDAEAASEVAVIEVVVRKERRFIFYLRFAKGFEWQRLELQIGFGRKFLDSREFSYGMLSG